MLKRAVSVASGLPSLAPLLNPPGGARGPSPTFDSAHLFLAFLTIGQSGSIGRQSLAKQTGLGEGAIRTVLKRLREDGYVEADTRGCHLTAAGEKTYGYLRRRLTPFVDLSGSSLTIGRAQMAVCAKGRAGAVKTGIEQRDSAIRVGASGATTYVYSHNRFAIPGGSQDCEKDFPGGAWALLRRELAPTNSDVVILCGARDATHAKLGALAAVATLLG